MRIAVGSDHRGYEIKTKVTNLLAGLGHTVEDVGTKDSQSVDYPDYAVPVAHRVANGQADRGILICGTGIGMAIVANKVSGIRAATCYNDFIAEMSRRHNNTNVLCLGADLLSETLIDRMVEIWINTEFEAGRHARRIEKIVHLEESLND